MEVKQALLDRRSVRVFEDRPVEKEKLEEILTAAVWAPTGGNAQPWVFIAVTKRETLKLIQTVSPGLLGNPKALIAILSDKPANVKKMGPIGATLAEMDCCFAAENILLRAHDVGLGACVIRSFNQGAVRKILGAPAGITPELLIIMGYAEKYPKAPPRDLNVIRWETYEGGA